MKSDRKERQYRTAITRQAICAYDFNLSQDMIFEEITSQWEDQTNFALSMVGLHAPCKYTEFFVRWLELVEEEYREAYQSTVGREALLCAAEDDLYDTEIEYWALLPDGKRHYIRQNFYLTKDELTGEYLVLSVAKDFTEEKNRQDEQQAALEEALLQAQSASRAKSTFLSNISHDIRTPMNAIIGFTALATTHADNKELVQSYMGKIMTSSNHLLSLINDVLDMSRIESGHLRIENVRCNLSDIMHDLKTVLIGQINAKQLELFMDTVDVLDEDVFCDKLRLNQILLNLIGNAIKFTRPNGVVSVRIVQKREKSKDGYATYEFHVKDNGIGMKEEFLEHIFEPFSRERTTTLSGQQGTGLGMSITKNIVDMMGGTIKVQSKEGIGTEFTVTLELALQSERRQSVLIKEVEGLRALVVDDDFDTCDSVTAMLRQIGMNAEWTMFGKEAVLRTKQAVARKEEFYAYIIDWLLPDMNGIEVARRIRFEVGESSPIIILTAYDWSEIEEEARLAGVTAFCAKPMFISDLRDTLLRAGGFLKENESDIGNGKVSTGKRILLVEDNELNREIAMEILREYGFEVEEAEDGSVAVEILEKARPGYFDVVLMDVQMPVMDGYEATKAIRCLSNKQIADIPIIAMTANAFEEDKEAAFAAGMNGHVAKPIDIPVLIKILSDIM